MTKWLGDDPRGRKAPPPSDDAKKAPSKKDRKKWCKGKVGREHILGIALHPSYGRDRCAVRYWTVGQHQQSYTICYHALVCVTCGRVMTHFLDKKHCPILSKLETP